ncbi:glutamate--tRNA ligase [Candidatus Magnetaquicoccus inordinatus]|uniref:glutamate--tRNA ligase n=1 Tax=Candidatus Magnetaquicoccus inordinatus TaxID=2496818 RepID=UPI00102D1439|nr:glutamate--tRNA ligase [Candidatus Magnetaquicoccus inordinatus]
MSVRTRFAPSPTGFLHIGGARTALFCQLHTRRLGGTFILRIEDTDRERSTQEAVDAIIQGLHWLGLDPDEGPYFQSDNTALYLAAAERLLAEGKAYRCYCSRESIDALRESQREQQIKPRYDGRCRTRTDFPAEQPFVIRFQTPSSGVAAWEDHIQGSIRFPNEELDDLILVRSDGSPTYNLAVVVDDHNMGINLVIRGEDHISNTPRQIHLFQALGWPVPEYAHMPLLHGSDGSKLSKRHGAVSVLQYREDGFLPDALNNYLLRLGWSHGEQELFTRQEMQELFNIREVGRSAAIFNLDKLLWINGHHIRTATAEQLLPDYRYQLDKRGIRGQDTAYLLQVITEFQSRAKTMVEMVDKSLFLFVDTLGPYEEKALKKHLLSALPQSLMALHQALAGLETWQAQEIDHCFRQVVADLQMEMGQLAQPVRVALTGTASSPGIHETLYLLGRSKSLQRLQDAIDFLQNKPK